MCTVQKCKFETASYVNCLVDHCKKVHKWRAMPCDFENCQFVGYNSLSLSSHKTGFHSKHKETGSNEFPCLWKGCSSSFSRVLRRDLHMRIHSNKLWSCSFCPYRTNEAHAMRGHYRVHYQIRNHKCEVCGIEYVNLSSLNQHYEEKHAQERTLTCHICNKFTGNKRRLQIHLGSVHNLLSRWNDKEKKLDTFERS